MAILVSMTALCGCGRQDLVPISGKIKFEGQAVTSGRLMLMPQGVGERAESLVDEEGAFRLRTRGSVGAKPGDYQVVYRRPMSEEKTQDVRIGDLRPEDIAVMYHSPPDKPLTISESEENGLEINVQLKQGWRRTVSD